MIGIIGGTGLCELDGLIPIEQKWYETPFGEPSSILSYFSFEGLDVVFLARHGNPHKLAPHLINYRANLSALKQAGATKIIAVNAVGGIHDKLGPQAIAVPDQIIDYTYGREATIFDGCHIEAVQHIDFTFPYDASLRAALITAAAQCGIDVLTVGTYAATQGPRLETAAEIQRLKRDGCDMVGMTGMPEAALARELNLQYASLALSVNWAAGLSNSVITLEEIEHSVKFGMGNVQRILQCFLLNAAKS
jgi:5'-deoxy-5'-methylthioadenosine phosphorylase